MNAFRRHLLVAAIAGTLTAIAGSAAVSAQPADQPAPKSEPIYGYQLMTPQERDEYRAKMRNARSAGERQAIRDEHHSAMQARAKERGLTLPDRPRGTGPYGTGQGRGPGAGPGARMGPPEGRGPGMRSRGPGYGPGAKPVR
jgi:hypothetical protein